MRIAAAGGIRSRSTRSHSRSRSRSRGTASFRQLGQRGDELPEKLSADSGYWSKDNAEFCAELGVDAHIATGRLEHGERPPPVRGRPPKNLDAKGKMSRKLRTKAGRVVYAKRKAIVEPVFGQCKEGRGFRRFLLRGLDKMRGEWSLICVGHNLLKLYRAGHAVA